MMDNATLELSGELGRELAAAARGEPQRLVDPRTAITRHSYLKQFSLCAARYAWACQEDGEDTLALRLGSGTHAMLLDQPVELYTGGNRDMRIKAYQAFVADCHARGVELILNQKEWDEAKQLADAIRRHKVAMRLLFEDTHIEETLWFKFLGKDCRATPDARGKRHLVDVKTCPLAKPDRFRWLALRLHYHTQLAFYGHAVEELFGAAPDDSYIVAVEKGGPNPVTVFRLTDRDIEQGRKQVRLWMEELLGCIAENTWPEYSESIVPLDITFPDDEPVELEIDGKLVTV